MQWLILLVWCLHKNQIAIFIDMLKNTIKVTIFIVMILMTKGLLAQDADIVDSLNVISIEDLDGKVIDDYLDAVKHIKHNNFGKFQTTYKVFYGSEKQTPDKTGNTCFVYKLGSNGGVHPAISYPLSPDYDSTATRLSAWNVWLAGHTLYYLDMPNKKFKEKHKDLELLLHKEKEGECILFTVFDRRYQRKDETTIKYNPKVKQVVEITRVIENSAFLYISFASIKTTLKLARSGRMLLPETISTQIITQQGSIIEIENTDLVYTDVSPKEYKSLKKAGVW